MKPLARFSLKLLIILAFVLQIAAALIVMYFGNAANCIFIRASNFRNAGDKIYVSEDTPAGKEWLLTKQLDSARQRVKDLWGDIKAVPVIIYCHSDFYHKKFGSRHGGANQWVTPFGSYIVIGPNNMDVNTISHELCHAELFKRTGFFNIVYEIPAWFDEGIASFMSHNISGGVREDYYKSFEHWYSMSLRTGIKEIKLEDIDSRKEFMSMSERNGNIGYYAAGMETARWYDKTGRQGLLMLIERLNNGENFHDAYREVEEIFQKTNFKSQ